MDYLAETKKYYANWLSVSPNLLNKDGIFCCYSPERDLVQEGYSKPFDFYGYISGQTVILTYGSKLEKDIDWIHEFFQSSKDLVEFKNLIQVRTGKNLQQDHKYYFSQLPSQLDISKAKQLTEQDYSDYLDFFKTMYPDSQAETWLASYFTEIVAKGYVFGLYLSEKLVSASDSPPMPYMKEKAVELGINTLPEYRNKGYGRIVFGAMLKFVTDTHKNPIVSCLSSNEASQRLIETVGFVKLADVESLSL